jgi:glutaredoxin
VTVTYVNVSQDAAGMKRMLEHSRGDRTVPVIVEGKKVTVGYNGAG